MSIRAVANYVIAEFTDDEDVTLHNGLVIKANVDKRVTRQAKVIAVGPKVLQVGVGDTICMKPHHTTSCEHNGVKLFRVCETDIEYHISDDGAD